MSIFRRPLVPTLKLLGGFSLLFLAVGLWAQEASKPFYFTVTSDLHENRPLVTRLFEAVKMQPEGVGAFLISVGDLADHDGQTPQNLRDLVDAYFGEKTQWWPVIGNHDTKSPSYSMVWLRREFTNGHNGHAPLKGRVLRQGPAGCTETTYSFDHGNAHFVVLNEYWNGKDAPGADYAAKGDVVPELRAWLEADLKATDKPFVFVFGHEPAFAQFRHVGDSLDQYPENRDAFWALLAKHGVQAFISGHIHFYYKQQKDGVYQIVDGAVGRDSEGHQTYLKVQVDAAEASISVWQNDNASPGLWKKNDSITLKPRQLPR